MAKIIKTFAIDLPTGHYRFTQYGESVDNPWVNAHIEVSKLGIHVIDIVREITREEYRFVAGWDVYPIDGGYSIIHYDSEMQSPKKVTDPMSHIINEFRKEC